MKLQSVLILIVSFLIGAKDVAVSQTLDAAAETKLPSNTFYFYIVNDYAIAYKFYNSGMSDFKIQLDLSSGYSDLEQDSESFNSPNLVTRSGRNSTYSGNYISAAFAYSYNFYRSDLGQAYAGAGPFVSYQKSNNEGDEDRHDQAYATQSSFTDKRNGYSAGIVGFVGVETFLTQSLRIFAESMIAGGRSWSKSDYSSDYINNFSSGSSNYRSRYETSSWFYNLRSVRIGLGISL